MRASSSTSSSTASQPDEPPHDKTASFHSEGEAPSHVPSSSSVPPATLVLVATPIGNLGDFSPRGAEALAAAELVLCEDTRTTARLLSDRGISARTEALHEHNERQRVPALVARLQAGARIALVSDAGMPLLSDPGYRLVRAAIEAGITVTAVPGPNAALTALVLSACHPIRFCLSAFRPPAPPPGARPLPDCMRRNARALAQP